MIKKLITTSVLSIGLALTVGAADDAKKPGEKGKGKGKGDRVAALMKADTDGDGKVSAAEFGKSKMAEMMNKRKEGAADKFFARVDADSDGFITKDEAAAAGKGKGGKKPGGDGKKPGGDEKKKAPQS